MINEIKNDYRLLKDQLFDYRDQDDNQDFIKLLQLKDIPDELKETLILLHSNYSAEIKEIKSHYTRLLIKMMDRDIDLLEYIKTELEKNQAIGTTVAAIADNNKTIAVNKASYKEDKESLVSKITNINRLHKTWGVIIITLATLVFLNEYSPEGLDKAISIFKSIFGFGMFPADAVTAPASPQLLKPNL